MCLDGIIDIPRGNDRAFTNNSCIRVARCYFDEARKDARFDTDRIANNYAEVIHRCCEYFVTFDRSKDTGGSWRNLRPNVQRNLD